MLDPRAFLDVRTCNMSEAGDPCTDRELIESVGTDGRNGTLVHTDGLSDNGIARCT